MKRCVIVCGADIGNYAFVRDQLSPDDFVIYCDSGLRHMDALAVPPSLIIGDFDSHPKPELPVEIITLPCEKDDTDSVYAAKEAVKRGYKDILLAGAVGGRLDHTLANVSILVMLRNMGVHARIVDDYSVMEMISGGPVEISGECSYFSVLNVTGTAEDIEISGAKYPLHGAAIDCSYQYGVSNQVLPGGTAKITVGKGMLLLIRVYKDSLRN